jgi:hypothetical protein
MPASGRKDDDIRLEPLAKLRSPSAMRLQILHEAEVVDIGLTTMPSSSSAEE